VNSLPKTVTRLHCDFDLNLGPSALESSTLTTRLLSHPNGVWQFATSFTATGTRVPYGIPQRNVPAFTPSKLLDLATSVGNRLPDNIL